MTAAGWELGAPSSAVPKVASTVTRWRPLWTNPFPHRLQPVPAALGLEQRWTLTPTGTRRWYRTDRFERCVGSRPGRRDEHDAATNPPKATRPITLPFGRDVER